MAEMSIPTVAEMYVKVLRKQDAAFVAGFTDGWHGEEPVLLRPENLLHDANVSYDVGYQLGRSHRWTQQTGKGWRETWREEGKWI